MTVTATGAPNKQICFYDCSETTDGYNKDSDQGGASVLIAQ